MEQGDIRRENMECKALLILQECIGLLLWIVLSWYVYLN